MLPSCVVALANTVYRAEGLWVVFLKIKKFGFSFILPSVKIPGGEGVYCTPEHENLHFVLV